MSSELSDARLRSLIDHYFSGKTIRGAELELHEFDVRSALEELLALRTPSKEGDGWRPISSASHELEPGSTVYGPLVYLRPSWGGWTVGHWHVSGYFEFIGEDGPHDEQPTHWRPLPAPSVSDTRSGE